MDEKRVSILMESRSEMFCIDEFLPSFLVPSQSTLFTLYAVE